MPQEAWLPVGFALPSGANVRLAVKTGENWQIIETTARTRALLAKSTLARRWADAKLIEPGTWQQFKFGDDAIYAHTFSKTSVLAPISDAPSPQSKSEALAFAVALRETRALEASAPLHDALYVEALSRLLPTYSLSSPLSDDVVLGTYLTGGMQVSVYSTRRIRQLLSWLREAGLTEVIAKADLKGASHETSDVEEAAQKRAPFSLAGRPSLESFFLEHVIDIIANADRYRALGIEFPSAIILHGPPGCGKTFAVERLIEYLEWPSFSIDATSIGSPFIHETSRKVAEVFEKAIKESPSVLVIDEMEAFLADRERGAGASHHRVEEVGEFLRRIPEATAKHVLIIAMTNRLEMIDPAIQRRGRFDHVVYVGMPSREEVEGLLHALFSKVPTEGLDLAKVSAALAGRPLSDVAFVVREAARLAARSGRGSIDAASVTAAVQSAPSRTQEEPSRRIGFVWDEQNGKQ
jgi:cell division protease FtsH